MNPDNLDNPQSEDQEVDEPVVEPEEDPQEPQDIEESIAQKTAEANQLLIEAQQLKEKQEELDLQKAEAVKHIPTELYVHNELINESADPKICDMHICIRIPAGDITFHEKIEIDEDTDTPVKRREWIRLNLDELIEKHMPPVYSTNAGPDVVGRWSIEGEFEEIGKELAINFKRETLNEMAVKYGLNPEEYETKNDIASAIVAKQWRP